MNAAILAKAAARPEPPSPPAKGIAPLGFKRVLAPTDFSEPSLKALDYALSLASSDGATVRMMHVLAPTPSFLNFDALSVLLPNVEAAGQCRQELERIAHELRHHEANITWNVGVGRPAPEIVQAARDFRADLLVVSTHGRTGLKHLLLNSVAEQIVRHAPCPVLIVRKAEREYAPDSVLADISQPRRILVPTDFSPRSLASLQYAARFARTFGGKITLLHCLHQFSGFIPSQYPTLAGDAYRAAEAEARQETDRRLQEYLPSDLAQTAIVRPGPPETEIAAFAEEEEIDFIICATRMSPSLEQQPPGHIVERIVRHAGCPVMVVGSSDWECFDPEQKRPQERV